MRDLGLFVALIVLSVLAGVLAAFAASWIAAPGGSAVETEEAGRFLALLVGVLVLGVGATLIWGDGGDW